MTDDTDVPSGAEVADPELWGELGRRVAFLRRTELFRNSSSSVLTHAATALQLLLVSPGDVIVRQGEAGDRFYLVESGTLSVQVELGGRTHEIARIGPGEFFGEIALLGQDCRTATVRATSSGHLWTLSAAEFQEILAREPEFAETIARQAQQRRSGARSTVFELEERNLASVLQSGGRLSLGRGADNDVVLDSPQVGEHHAVVERRGDTYSISDQRSGAPTLVNGVEVTNAELHDGDEIRLGDQLMLFDRRELVHVLERRGVRIDAEHLTTEIAGGKRLLNDVSLSILPGEFVAIVGGSGAGKTTLMDALAGVRQATSGTVLYNGFDYYADPDRFRPSLGYVPQDDIIHEELPLRQTIRYSAMLRLPLDSSAEQTDRVVDETLAALDLSGRADVRVAALSGGQRKRASIAVEFLTRPRAFFLDEPTSGLDPATEAQMMRLMRRLADEGSTVVLTTHATANLMMCDKIVFLARDGHLAFTGSPHRALAYFDASSFDEIYWRLSEEATPEEWDRRFRESEDRALAELPDDRMPEEAIRQERGSVRLARRARLQLRQARVLSQRNIAIHLRDPGQIPQIVMPPVVFTLLLIVLFRSNLFDADTVNPSAPMQLLFVFSFIAFLFGLLFAVQDIVKEFPVFFRERQVGVRVLPYLASKLAFQGPFLLVSMVGMTVALWATDRLPQAGLDVYAPLLLTILLTAFSGLTLALFTSSIVSNSQQATDLVTPWIAPQVLFAGALIAVPAMNVVGRVVSAVASVRWSFEAVANITDLNGLFARSSSPIGEALLLQYESSFSRSPGQAWLILMVFVLAPLVGSAIVLKRRKPWR